MRDISVDPAVWHRLLRLKEAEIPAADPDPGPDPGMDPQDPAWSLYAPIARIGHGRPTVLAQIGQSLDGRIATPSGDSRNVSGADGLAHLHRCRALVDAVVVGIGTVLADDPSLTVRLAPGDSPVRVVIDPAGRMPPSAQMLQDDGPPVILIHAEGVTPAAGTRPVALRVRGRRMDPAQILAVLAGWGLRRVLIEGGATTIGHFLDAGQVDRLHVAISPILIGSGPCGLALRPIETLNAALRPETEVYHLGTDVLFVCRFGRGSHAHAS